MNSQKLIRQILMWFGMVLVMIVFVPNILEYLGVGEEKDFGTKEITILSIGFLLAVGAKYWDRIVRYIIALKIKKSQK